MDNRCPYLLMSLVSVLLVYPYLLGRSSTEALLVLLNATVVVTAIYAVRHSRSHLITALVIGIPQLAVSWLNVVVSGGDYAIAQAVLTILFYGYALVRVLDYVLRGRDVTLDKIYGAAGVYLLMGYMWASCFDLVLTLQPDAFAMNGNRFPEAALAFRDLVHFSFVTLTSLGYGDITPVSDQARSLAFLEVIAGNLYMALLVARLVGAYRPEQETPAAT